MYRELSEYFNNLLIRLSAESEEAERHFQDEPDSLRYIYLSEKRAQYDLAVKIESAIMNIVKE